MLCTWKSIIKGKQDLHEPLQKNKMIVNKKWETVVGTEPNNFTEQKENYEHI